jgi:hypothetical protein
MEKNKNAWKDHLLRSGLPLEFEVKKFLDEYGCISNMERTYLRNNEVQVPAEFSYDIDSSYIKGEHFIDLMIECKYRHESVRWVFLPETYGSIDEISHTGFMHPVDHFNTHVYRNSDFPIAFGPLCSKGVELTSDGANPKTITQAIAQLAYAMADKVTNAILHQTDEVLSTHFKSTTFYNIPIIMTTAQLYRLREKVDIKTIKASELLEDIATNEPFLVLKAKSGSDLLKYNQEIFRNFIMERGPEELTTKLKSFSDNPWFILDHIAKNNCPNSIVVIQHTTDNRGLVKFFEFINRVIKPDQEIFDLIKQKDDEHKAFFEKFERDHPGVDLSGGVKVIETVHSVE